MIVFDLKCGAAHVFEAWFGSSADYEQQKARGLLSCPMCGDPGIDKAVMAPAVAAKGNRAAPAMPMATGADAERKAMLAALARAQKQMLEGSDWVGSAFAAEVRDMHNGDRPQRAIHGEATPDEARALIEDGLPVAPLPFPVTPPGREN